MSHPVSTCMSSRIVAGGGGGGGGGIADSGDMHATSVTKCMEETLLLLYTQL